MVEPHCSNFRVITTICVRIFRKFMVLPFIEFSLHLQNFFLCLCCHSGYIQKIGSKSNMPEDNTKDRSEIPTVVIRNRNLNRGVLKPKEPVKATTPPNKTEKIEHRVNLARTKKTVDTVDSQKSVPGGTNYVPSKETKIKKDTGDKRKQVESSKKEVVVENKEPVIDQVLKENSLTDIGEWGVLCCHIIMIHIEKPAGVKWFRNFWSCPKDFFISCPFWQL